MRHLLVLILFSFHMVFIEAQSAKMMTYNIRYDSPNDGENRWIYRKDFLANQIRFHEPDVFGIQEGMHHQVEFLDSMLADYDYAGVGRDDGKTKGEYSALFYRSSVFAVMKQETFWLSQTPGKISVGWDAALERICTYALLKHRESSRFIWVFNTHFDHRGEQARQESANLIIEKIKAVNKKGYPVILMGDLNLEPHHPSIHFIESHLNDSHNACNICFGPKGTFNGFSFCKPVTRRIDYIFVSKDIIVNKYAVLSDSREMKYPSDHMPVYVELDF